MHCTVCKTPDSQILPVLFEAISVRVAQGVMAQGTAHSSSLAATTYMTRKWGQLVDPWSGCGTKLLLDKKGKAGHHLRIKGET